MTKRVLLTGASGFVGSHVLRRILRTTDWEVVCLTTFQHHGLQDRMLFATDNLDEHMGRIKIITCDLSSPISSITSKKFGKINYVINLASESHVDRSIQDPAPFVINNVQAICNILEWVRENRPEKVIHLSTDEVYGSATDRPFEEWDLHLPSNPYSASKAAQENIVFSYWRTYDIPIAIINVTNMVGECQNVEKFTPLIIKKILNNDTVDIHTYDIDKIGKRYWLYVGNTASAILHVLDQQFVSSKDSSRLSRWNLGSNDEYTNLEWAEKIASVIKKPLQYKLVDSETIRPGYDFSYSLDSSRLLSSGWNPEIDLDAAIETTVKWYLNNPEWL